MTSTPPAVASWVQGVRRETLPNGLTLLVQRDRSAPVAALITHVRAGFFDEPDTLVGVSHVLEHMFFKGTPTRGVGEIPRQTRALGGYLNAGTGYDATVYYTVFPAASASAAVAIQADALRNSVIDAEELARELQVIIQEVKRKRDSAGAVTTETLFAALHRRHRIRRWRIGDEADLARLTRDDILGYYRSRYVPGRTIVSLVGDVDPDRALVDLRAAYADWESRPDGVTPGPTEPDDSRPRVEILRGDVAEAHLACGWRGVPPLDPMAVPLEFAAGLLSTGRGSWLYRSLRAPGTVTSIGAYHYAPTEVGVFGVGAELAPERLEEAIAGVAAAVARLAERPAGAEDLDRVRALFKVRWARRMETMDGRAAALAAAEALGGIHLLDEEYARLETTSAGDVRDAVARSLRPDRVGAAIYLPEVAAGVVDRAALERLFGDAEPLARNGRARATIPAPPSPEGIAAIVRSDVVVAEDAGCDVLVQQKPGAPLVSLGLYFPRTDAETLADAGIAGLAVRSAMRGAAGLDAEALAFAGERLGGVVAPRAGSDWMGFTLEVAADRLAEGAALLRAVATEPTMADEDIREEQIAMVSEARLRTDDMVRYPFQLAFGAAFGDRGYGVPSAGLPESLAAGDPAAVRRRYGELLRAGRPVVVAVGAVDAERAAAVLVAAFRGLSTAPRAAPRGAVPWAPAGGERTSRRAKSQTALAMVFPGPGRRVEERHAAEVWAAVAGGLGGELFVALRDRRSLAYTVLATSWQRLGAGALAGYIATAPEREAEAREQMLAELARYTTDLVDSATLVGAVNYVSGQWLLARQRNAAVAATLADTWLAGEPVESIAEIPKRYGAVTAEDVRAVCRAAFAGPPVIGMVRGTEKASGARKAGRVDGGGGR